MRLTLMSLVRLTALLFLGLFAVAVGISRAVPRISTLKIPAEPRYIGINGSSFETTDAGSYLLDSETGRLTRFNTPAGIKVDYLACAPWRDEQNGEEFVGRVLASNGVRGDALFDGSGLGRFRISGGTWGNQMEVASLISGRPCWLTGSTSRVVFPTADGLLYVQEIENDSEEFQPLSRPITWACATPGEKAFLNDPYASRGTVLGGRLLVSLYYHGDHGKGPFSAPAIWWLKLDRAGHTIVAAGRVTEPDSPGNDDRYEEERLPNLCTAPDGRVALAYLTRPKNKMTFQLKLAPVSFDADGNPSTRASDVVELSDDCAMAAPAFSPDGRWLYRVSRKRESDDVVRRFSVAEALGASSARIVTAAGDGEPLAR